VSGAQHLSLRRLALGVSVLDDLDLDVTTHGIRVAALVDIGWDELEHAVSPHDPDDARALRAARSWVGARLQLASMSALQRLALIRPVSLPVGHALHPGPLWIRDSVAGDSLDSGLGMRGLGPDPEAVVVLDPTLGIAAGIEPSESWVRASEYREEMVAYAVARLARDPLSTLRCVGDCDVPTLLSSPTFREQIVSVDATGMRSAAVPLRTHGWLDLGRIDPLFAASAAATVDEYQRGFARPLLITRDEVVQVREGGTHRESGFTVEGHRYSIGKRRTR